MDYIQTLQKEQCDHEQKMKVFEKGNLVLWMSKDEKIKMVSLGCHGKDHINWEKYTIITL
jgi:hypothetical protein